MVYDTWNGEFHRYFVKVSHHEIEPSLEEFSSKLADFEHFLAKYVFPLQTEIYDFLDDLFAKPPEEVDYADLKLFLSRNQETHRYFFMHVPASWLEFLNTQSLLEPSWPVVDYLLRSAPERPKETMAIITKQELNGDDRAMGIRFIESANVMPLEIGVAILSKVTEERWIDSKRSPERRKSGGWSPTAFVRWSGRGRSSAHRR